MRIVAVLLAAGAAERFGGPAKLLADLGGKPLIVHAARALADSAIASLIAVTGRDAHEIETVLKAHPQSNLQVVHNADWRQGMGGSIAAGIRALAPDIDGALIVPGDMPFLTASFLNELLCRFEKAGQPILYPQTADGMQVSPVLWPRRFFTELAQLSGPSGGKRLLQRYACEAVAVPVRDAGLLADIDTPDALDAARQRLANL